MSSNSNPSFAICSISDILRLSCLTTGDLGETKRVLIGEKEKEKEAAEAHWSDKCDVLDAERSELRLKVIVLENEVSKLNRECQIYGDKLSDLERGLRVSKEREDRVSERLDRALGDLRATQGEKDELVKQLQQLEDLEIEIADLKRQLREKDEVWERGKREKEAEIEGKRKEVEDLEELNAKKDVDLEEMRGKVEELMKENASVKSKWDNSVREMEQKDEKIIKELMEKNATFEEVRRERDHHVAMKSKWDNIVNEMADDIIKLRQENEGNEAKIECLEREKREILEQKESLKEMVSEKDEIIKELMEEKKATGQVDELRGECHAKIECLEREKRELLKLNESLEEDKTRMMGKFKEVEKEFNKLEGDVVTWLYHYLPQVEKLASSQVEKIVCEVSKVLDREEVDATSNVEWNDDVELQEEGAESDNKQEAMRVLTFATEIPRENHAIGIKKGASTGIIVLSDSDCDENPSTPNKRKRKRASLHFLSQRDKDYGSIKHMKTPLSKCNKMLEKEDDAICTPKAKDLIADLRRKRGQPYSGITGLGFPKGTDHLLKNSTP